VNYLNSLVPTTVERGAVASRLGVAFGGRFFLLLAVGLIWLGPAFFDPRFVQAMIAWDALLLAAWGIDLLRLPRPGELKLARSWSAPTALSVSTQVTLTLRNDSSTIVHASILDGVPLSLRNEPPRVELSAPPGREQAQSYTIRPVGRGQTKLGRAYLRYQGPWRIAERWAEVPLEQSVSVYPDLEEAKRHTVYLVRSRQIEMEKRRSRPRGLGREFESLREYQDGDDVRDICWSASARRGKLVTRLYQIERSQTVWIVLDCGRLMRARIGALSKLDYAANAALSLAQVALYSGDRVGILSYGRSVKQRVPAARGSAHLRLLMEQLAVVKEETAEGDHLQTANRLLTDQKRRSLVVWLTDLAETAMTPEVIEAAARLMPRHLVLFLVIGQPDLGALAAREPADEQEMFDVAAAQEVVHRREILLARLRERGALALEVNSKVLSTTLVNSYLQVKERSQL